MSEVLVKQWQQIKNEVSAAKAWQALPSGQKYQGDSFAISIPHCAAPKLVRAGQQTFGGENYWETDELFNKTILEYLVKNWKTVYPEVIAMMESKEKEALQFCQSYVDEMQALINSSKDTN